MSDIEQKISPLVASMFPSFYQEEGEDFVAFVKAYYEWLEQNHQLLQLEDNTNFNVGDTIAQQEVTGTVVAFVGNDLLVRVDNYGTFKCFNVCSELIPVTSSSGGNTYIKRGGTTRRLGTLFLARNLLNIRDIDKTLDLFIVRFKEKYLKNIQFDVLTNKQLLVKNSLDLYRSKGTERSIDLFFRLIYGVSTEVYYPGEDLFKLSAGEWYKPQYIEITGTDRAIELVGKQITGVTSGATAFVEKYIKRKIKNGFVYVLYLSNVNGEFINRELLRDDKTYDDSPVVVGSLTSVEIVTGSKLFNVGDIVRFNSARGDYGLARVASVNNDTGVVDFLFLDGGYGYTTSADPAFSELELEKRTQSIVSEKVLTLANVVTSNVVAGFTVTSGGTGYSNNDVIKVVSQYSNALAKPTTNGSGSILYVTVTEPGSGFYTNTVSYTISNSSGGATTGSGAVLVGTTKEQTYYYKYLEQFTEKLATVFYDSATNNELLVPGTLVKIGNSFATANTYGTILSNANGTLVQANGVLTLSIANNQTFAQNNKIYVASNSSINANVAGLTDTSATSTIMGLPNTATITLTSLSDSTPIERSDEIYQLDANGSETGNATVVSAITTETPALVELENLKGVIRQGRQVRFRDKSLTANVVNVQLQIGVYDIVNNYSNTFAPMVFSTNTGTTANVLSISQGSGASFRVGTISEEETIYLNTDLLNANNKPTVGANQSFMSVPLSALEYGFPKNPTGNSSAIIWSCLNFDSFTIGTIGTLTAINPGDDYNVDPYVLARQPYISGFNYRDYVIELSNVVGTFAPGEKINQTNTVLQKYDLVVDNETGFQPGDKIYQGTFGSQTANAVIDAVFPTLNTIRVSDKQGTLTTGQPIISAGAKTTAFVYNNAANNQLFVNGASIRVALRVDFAGNTTAVTVGNATSKGFITLGTANTAKFANGEAVTYIVPAGQVALGGLQSNGTYYINTVNSTAIQLSVTPGGTAVNISSVPTDAELHRIERDHGTGVIINNANGTLANANGTLYATITSGYANSGDVLYAAANNLVVANIVSITNTSLQTTLTSSTLYEEVSTAKAIVKSSNTSMLFAKRIQFENLFEESQQIKGAQSGATATIYRIREDANTLPIGLNAAIEANVVTANGTVTSLEIIDSGAGYANGEIMAYVSEDGSRAGEAKAIVSGLGTGSGYYKTSKGFLSAVSKIHDGDYYQEYSYEILSRIPLDKYKDMFKKVMHTAGTRYFGGVLLEDLVDVKGGVAGSEFAIKNLEVAQFNANSNVASFAIVIDNVAASGDWKFANGQKVVYYTDGNGNTAIQQLANGAFYYAANVTASSIQLQTNPRTLTKSFNASEITSNFISMPRHNFVTNDVVRYTTAAGNTVVSGLANNSVYHIVQANSSGVKLSATRGGSAIAISAGANQTGHTLTITAINITANVTASGAATNGHYIETANEI